jgi:Fe-S cluster assembly protein SufD
MVTSPRMLVTLAENAQATVIETHLSQDTGVHFTNAQGEISVAEGAHLTHLKIQRESEAAFHIACVRFHQGKDSNVFSSNITLGAALTRNDIGALIGAEGAHCALDGLNMVSGTQHVDNHTLLDHAMPNCTSHQLYKSIIDDRATTVFNGRIVVHQDAQRTDAVQSNHSLLLAETATAHTQPNLEIFADDVKCTHGATVGNIDAGAVFYLRSRGVPEDEARALLTFAFANEIIDEIAVEPIRQTLESLALARFKRTLGER